MKKIKNSIKALLLTLTVKCIKKSYILNNLLTTEEKESIKHIKSGYLHHIGWWNSWKTKNPIDIDNNPLPWVTYSFIDFIENRLTEEMTVFEFGSGNSTLFYSSLVKEVHTVEHDKDWFNKISGQLPLNVNINNIELKYGGDYSKASSINKSKYDVIIVDGRDRVNCLINSISSLKQKGIIILDDSERKAYEKGINFLLDLGYKKLDFWGISPGLFYKKCTSIYYKKENILGI